MTTWKYNTLDCIVMLCMTPWLHIVQDTTWLNIIMMLHGIIWHGMTWHHNCATKSHCLVDYLLLLSTMLYVYSENVQCFIYLKLFISHCWPGFHLPYWEHALIKIPLLHCSHTVCLFDDHLPSTSWSLPSSSSPLSFSSFPSLRSSSADFSLVLVKFTLEWNLYVALFAS